MKEEIEIITKIGHATGFVAPNNHKELINYIEQNLGRTGVLSECAKFNEIGVLCDLFINENHQGKGLGKELLSDFIFTAKRKGARVVILLLDTAQEQRDNFVLSKFYLAQGFVFMENKNWMIKY